MVFAFRLVVVVFFCVVLRSIFFQPSRYSAKEGEEQERKEKGKERKAKETRKARKGMTEGGI